MGKLPHNITDASELASTTANHSATDNRPKSSSTPRILLLFLIVIGRGIIPNSTSCASSDFASG